ncbi:MAG: hypothetical protein JNM51_04640 [Bacteroidia bacterium]|nr:hypothetical protein [Bacteroidia bacterium]
MRNVFKNLGIGFGIFTLIVLMGTCICNHKETPVAVQPDNSYIKVLKAKQTELDSAYQKHVQILKREKDSLIFLVSEKKKSLSIYRYKSNELENQLRVVLAKVDSSNVLNDSISPLAETYFAIQLQRDSACNESIRALEIVGFKQDSVILFQNLEKDNLKALQKEQEQKEIYLTQQLNTAYKQQKKAVLKSRILTGTLILISGFTSALLINQTLK